jgi:hypothetical protein
MVKKKRTHDEIFEWLTVEQHHEIFQKKWKISNLNSIRPSPILTWLRNGPPYPTDFTSETNVLVTCSESKMNEIIEWLTEFQSHKIWYVDGRMKFSSWREHFTAVRQYKKDKISIAIFSFEKRIDLAVFKITFGPDILFTEQE